MAIGGGFWKVWYWIAQEPSQRPPDEHLKEGISPCQGRYREVIGLVLKKMGSKFQAITQCALNGYYNSKIVFTEVPSLKLITKIMKMNEKFANDFWKKGHKRHFSPNWDDEGEKIYMLTENNDNSMPFEDLLQNYPELHDIIDTDKYQCPNLKAFNDNSIMDHIERVYQSNRGPELGTLLAHICPDKQVRDQLWETLLVDELRKAYVRAMEQACFLLRIEREGRPSTYNHYFNSEVQKKRQDRMTAAIANKTDTHYISDDEPIDVVPVTRLRTFVVNKDNAQQVREAVSPSTALCCASRFQCLRQRNDPICLPNTRVDVIKQIMEGDTTNWMRRTVTHQSKISHAKGFL
ncbi:hypothetical protein K469DRAFT_696978 [Zopfia rhizophila CBS 207.26]|uniref:Uncharacterized protein n=1 Tax=Zopfia rhizophila CBS 207.26 TaxID=1314779 RepID=A0A6A6EMH4_9PEZI|nr:hypothetical protein K469DRAFT_696978 [Zopfia rhizophila CBS 207.26]